MRYSDAKTGLIIILIASIVSFICLLTITVVSILGIVSLVAKDTRLTSDSFVVSLSAVNLYAVIVSAAAFFIKLLGAKKASNSSPGFFGAFVAFGLTALAKVIMICTSGIIRSAAAAVSVAAGAFALIFIVLEICKIARDFGDTPMIKSGKALIIMIIAASVAPIVILVVTMFPAVSESGAASYLLVAECVFEFVQFAFFILYLIRAVRMIGKLDSPAAEVPD